MADSNSKSWIGVDLDGTLAHYSGWTHHMVIGAPIEPMVRRVKEWLAAGKTVKIMTARANVSCYYEHDPVSGRNISDMRDVVHKQEEAIIAIRAWSLQNLGADLEVTCCKDMHMVELWDDRAVEVEANTGGACLLCAAKRMKLPTH